MSEAPVVVVVVVGEVVLGEAEEDMTDVGRGWGCSSAAGTGRVEGSSSAAQQLAYRHVGWMWWAWEEVLVGGYANQASTSAGAAGEEEGRRTWRSAARSCAGAGGGSDRQRCARDFEGSSNGPRLQAIAASTVSWSRSEA